MKDDYIKQNLPPDMCSTLLHFVPFLHRLQELEDILPSGLQKPNRLLLQLIFWKAFLEQIFLPDYLPSI